MEERIQEIIRSNSPESVLPLADGVLGFAHHQIIELARDCLEKSRLGLITSSYFCELTDKLERLVQEVSVSSVTVEMRFLGGTGHGNVCLDRETALLLYFIRSIHVTVQHFTA